MEHTESRPAHATDDWLERVLTGNLDPQAAAWLHGVSCVEMRSLLRGLINKRTQEQGWEAAR
jgi:DNA-nicking Smr family endonuclease